MKTLVDPVRLQALLGATRWNPIRVVTATASTNSDVAVAARGGAPEGLVIIADFQQQGRGRFSREWTARPGDSVAISALVRPALPMEQWGWLPLMAGVAVANALANAADVPAGLKWPNDVMVDDRKICGILGELVDTPEGPAAVIGMGINTAMTREHLPVATATSLAILGVPYETTHLTAAVLRGLDDILRRVAQGTHPHADYLAQCRTIGKHVRVQTSATDSVEGTAVGVDRNGHLVVDVDGRTRTFAAGDVVHLR